MYGVNRACVAAQALFDFHLFFWYASVRRILIKKQLRAQVTAWCALAKEQIKLFVYQLKH
jgi:hypothetical protein